MEGVKACELGETGAALDLLTRAAEAATARAPPTSARAASVLNNRAQVRRLLGDLPGAMADLEAALRLSAGRGRAARQAYCQRGLLLRRDGRDDEAMADFRRAAELGSGFAKSVLVQFNPYAAMCNKMLKSVFQVLGIQVRLEDGDK